MPIINITLIAGYDEGARTRLAERVTDATMSVIDAPADLVTVVVNEAAPANYMRGRVNRQPGPALAVQSSIVESYLLAMEQRDLRQAAEYLASGFTMQFPGGVTFTQPQELVAWASSRYQSITKHYTQMDECYQGEKVIVYCYGTLQGIWPEGEAFNDIRFIDRFTLCNNLIVEQQVWNDLAEHRVVPAEVAT